jgi:hypothetical protein
MINLGCYANCRELNSDTSITIEQAKRARIKDGIVYPRESIKGHK